MMTLTVVAIHGYQERQTGAQAFRDVPATGGCRWSYDINAQDGSDVHGTLYSAGSFPIFTLGDTIEVTAKTE